MNLLGECISGALWWKDLVTLAKDLGFSTPRLVSSSVMEVGNEELQAVVGRSFNPGIDQLLLYFWEKHI